jgi:hypothetical protein
MVFLRVLTLLFLPENRGSTFLRNVGELHGVQSQEEMLFTTQSSFPMTRVLFPTSYSYSFIHQWLYSPLLGPGPFYSFVILYTVDRTPWTGDRPVARPLPTHRTAQTQNKGTETSMPLVGFESKIPLFKLANSVHATVIGISYLHRDKYQITYHRQRLRKSEILLIPYFVLINI